MTNIISLQAAGRAKRRLSYVLHLAWQMEPAYSRCRPYCVMRTGEQLIEAFERYHPEMLPLTDDEIKACLTARAERDVQERRN